MASWKEIKAASEEGDLEAAVIYGLGLFGASLVAFVTIVGVIVFLLVS